MFDTLILPHLPQIRIWVQHFAERKAECDDLFQEVLIEIFQNIDQAATARHLVAWLYVLTRRKVRLLNARFRRAHLQWSEPPSASFFDEIADHPTVSLESSAAGDASSSLHDTLLLRALDQLTPTEREVILARSEGERQADIAVRLGVSQRCVSKYETSARCKLQSYLRPALARRHRKSRIIRARRGD